MMTEQVRPEASANLMTMMMSVLVMSGGLTRDPARHVEAFFTESNNSASCFLPALPADRNFNTLDYVEGKLVMCGGDGNDVINLMILITQ